MAKGISLSLSPESFRFHECAREPGSLSFIPFCALQEAEAGIECVPDSDRAAVELIHQLAQSMGRVIDAKDHHTLAHSEEVALAARFLALEMGLPRCKAELIHVAGHLHDIGKIGIPDRVLLKKTKLSSGERIIIESHAAVGADILKPLDCLRETGIVEMVLHHHERFDGKGYPHGLAEHAIPLGARIIAVADSLSAMLQSRPYRPHLSFLEATTEIYRGSGTQFDPEVVEAFSTVRRELKDMLGHFRRVTRRDSNTPKSKGRAEVAPLFFPAEKELL